MFYSSCPCCKRFMRTATVSAFGLVVYHVAHETLTLYAEPGQPVDRHEHAPENVPVLGKDMPGFYSATASTTTTAAPITTTLAPMPTPTITGPQGWPAPGAIVAWDDGSHTWGSITDCGFRD